MLNFSKAFLKYLSETHFDMRFPTSRALPKKFFGRRIGIFMLAIRDLKDEFIDL